MSKIGVLAVVVVMAGCGQSSKTSANLRSGDDATGSGGGGEIGINVNIGSASALMLSEESLAPTAELDCNGFAPVALAADTPAKVAQGGRTNCTVVLDTVQTTADSFTATTPLSCNATDVGAGNTVRYTDGGGGYVDIYCSASIPADLTTVAVGAQINVTLVAKQEFKGGTVAGTATITNTVAVTVGSFSGILPDASLVAILPPDANGNVTILWACNTDPTCETNINNDTYTIYNLATTDTTPADWPSLQTFQSANAPIAAFGVGEPSPVKTTDNDGLPTGADATEVPNGGFYIQVPGLANPTDGEVQRLYSVIAPTSGNGALTGDASMTYSVN